MARFIEITHEVYKNKVGDKFGTIVPCIFTDEPQFAMKTQLSNPRARNDVFLPWTTDITKSFKKEYGSDLIQDLPHIIWDLPEGNPSESRYRYHDHVCERFVSAFMDQLSAWCRKNNIMLDGHMMNEPELRSQTFSIGEAMRCYRNMVSPWPSSNNISPFCLFLGLRSLGPPVGVWIRDAILVFNVLWLEQHLEPNCHFIFLNVPWSKEQSKK